MGAGKRVPDPQWEFMLLIRSALEHEGSFDFEVDTRDTQSMVDLQWAAHQAARLLGVEVEFELGPRRGHAGSVATATVRRVTAADAPERTRVVEGLDRLCSAVREVQRTGCVPVPVPTPRAP